MTARCPSILVLLMILAVLSDSMDLGSSASGRKLMQIVGGGRGGADGGGAQQTDRIGDECSKEDIRVYQGATAPLPSGIPTYTVEVHNMCSRGCGAMAGIHFSCGWFASARLINPKVFRRIRYDVCLVNDGRPLRSGGTISFQYANTFKYRLSVASANCTGR